MSSDLGTRLQRIIDSAQAFLAADSTTSTDFDSLIHFMDARPPMTSTQSCLPIEDIEERLRLAANIQTRVWEQQEAKSQEDREEYRLTAFELSTILAAPLRIVQKWAEDPIIPPSVDKLVRIGMLCFI